MVRLDALDHHPCTHRRPHERRDRERIPTSDLFYCLWCSRQERDDGDSGG
jgi:hypothetical protein